MRIQMTSPIDMVLVLFTDRPSAADMFLDRFRIARIRDLTRAADRDA